jgi:hypothetical protein
VIESLLLVGIAVVVLLVWSILRGSSRQVAYDEVERSAMPAEIACSRLVFSERTFQTDLPVPLSARVDQVYLTEQGVLVPIETKRRHATKIWPADVIELSVQAVVLANHRDVRRVSRRVADYGYVRIAPEGRQPTYLRTPLLPSEQVALIHDRYFDLHAGRVQPEPARNPGLCRKCGQRARCPVGKALPVA